MRRLTFLPASALALLLMADLHHTPVQHDFSGLKVRLQTADLQATVRFYHHVLGLEIVDQWAEEGDAGVIFGLEDATGKAFLEFGLTESPDNGAASVQLRVPDMTRFLSRLEHQWEVDGPHMRPWGNVYTYLTDPSGIRVIVYQGRV